jgi:hypothetical protein
LRPRSAFLAAHPDVEFDHALALELKIGTVAELRARMSYLEWITWAAFLKRKHAAEQQAIAAAQRKAQGRRRRGQ